MEQNRIIFGDNLEVMRGMEANCVALCATDPPFNSGRDYNIFLKDSQAQNKAFTDIWVWDDVARETREEIEELAKGSEKYQQLNRALLGYDHLLDHSIKGPESRIRSYLTFMGPRIVEIHRLLNDQGALYLHCDPNASHYLKGLLDIIFGPTQFRNEIIWVYSNMQNNSKRSFQKNNDIILYYTKSDNCTFNPLFKKEMSPTMKSQLKRGYHRQKLGTKRELNVFDRNNPKVIEIINSGEYREDQIKYLDKDYAKKRPKISNVWTDIPRLPGNSKERLGYPTQKPRALYERIISASSNEGDLVLDPFCGCGTTLEAAQELNRKWIGIDITNLALTPMEQRLSKNYNLVKGKDYQILGYPTNMQEIERFLKVEKKYHEVANWAINELGLLPTKDIGDGGIDGIGYGFTWTPEGMKQETCKIVAEVKTGNISTTQIRAFCHSMDEFKAKIGIIVTFHKPTKGMLEYQEKQGRYEHNGKTYFRLQILHIDETYFTHNGVGTQIKIPGVIRKTMDA